MATKQSSEVTVTTGSPPTRAVSATTTVTATPSRALTTPRSGVGAATTSASATGRLVKRRSPTGNVIVTATATRSGVAFTRQGQTTTTTAAATTRSLTLPRTVTDTATVDTAVTRDKLLPRQASSDTTATAAATVAVHDVFPTGLQEHELIYDPERALFHTEWFNGGRVRPDAAVVAVRLAPNIGVSTVDVAVEIDADDDERADRRSSFREITDENIPRTFTTTPREGERMRIAFKNVRFDDIINQVNTAVTTR